MQTTNLLISESPVVGLMAFKNGLCFGDILKVM
jgi:hypothetical protein